jgi:hypothetical protein
MRLASAVHIRLRCKLCHSRDTRASRCCVRGSRAATACSPWAQAQGEAIEALVVAQVCEHRLYGRDTAAVKGFAALAVDRLSYELRVWRGGGFLLKEGHLSGRRVFGVVQATRSELAGATVAVGASKLVIVASLDHARAARRVQLLARGATAVADATGSNVKSRRNFAIVFFAVLS